MQDTAGAASAATIPGIVGQLITALVTASGGLVAPLRRAYRFSRIEDTVSRFEPAARRFYVWPQYVSLTVVLLSTLLLSLAFIGGALDLFQSDPPPFMLTLYDNGPLLILGAVVALVISSLDLTTRVLVWVLTLPRLSSDGKPDPDASREIGLIQVKELLASDDEATPLLVCETKLADLVERIASLTETSDGAESDRAAPPRELSPEKMANVLFFGNILEALHSDRQWPTRKWGSFFRALCTLAKTSELLDPQTIHRWNDHDSYYDALRAALAPHLAKNGERELPTAADAATTTVEPLTRWLRDCHEGSALSLSRSVGKSTTGAASAVERQLKLSRYFMDHEGTRAQFIKLGLCWGVWKDERPGVFPFPFSEAVAWLLLERKVISPLDNISRLTFSGPLKRTVVRAVVARVADRVVQVARGPTATGTAIARRYSALPDPEFQWQVAYEADFQLWNLAHRELAGVPEAWKLADRVVRRV